MRPMRRAHTDYASKSVYVESDLFDVRRMQLRQFGKITRKLPREFDDCLLRLGQSPWQK
jgi:hypothetical protein